MFKNWNERHKRKLFNYAGDIMLFSLSSTELQEMVQEMHVPSERIAPQMNINKTKIMTNTEGEYKHKNKRRKIGTSRGIKLNKEN